MSALAETDPGREGRLRRALEAHHGLRRAAAARPHAGRPVRHLLAREIRAASRYTQLMYDLDGTAAIAERAVLELDPDTVSPLVLQTAMGPTLDAVDYKQLQWPGHGVGDNQPYQYLDREYMKPEEYDDFLFDPTGYYLRIYLPRIMGAFEGFSEFPEHRRRLLFPSVRQCPRLRSARRCRSRGRDVLERREGRASSSPTGTRAS